MKVRLAVQTFSNSVSDVLVFCNEDDKLDTFKGSEPTIEFCRRMNNIFDLLNTRNLISKSLYCKAITLETKENIFEYISESIEYIKTNTV